MTISPAASQAPYPSLRRRRQSSLIPLLRLFRRTPASLGCSPMRRGSETLLRDICIGDFRERKKASRDSAAGAHVRRKVLHCAFGKAESSISEPSFFLRRSEPAMLGFAAKNERTFPLSLTSPPATAKGGRRIRKAAEPLTATLCANAGECAQRTENPSKKCPHFFEFLKDQRCRTP